jgi:hypothetical protein
MEKKKDFIPHMSSVFSGMASGTISKTPVNLSFPFLILLSQKRSQARRMLETPRLGGRVNHPHQRFYGRQCRFCCQMQKSAPNFVKFLRILRNDIHSDV